MSSLDLRNRAVPALRLRLVAALAPLLLFACGDKEERPVLHCETFDQPGSVSYSLDIEPVLSARCGICHVAEAQGESRFGAPPEANFDTHEEAQQWADRIFERAYQGGMPPEEVNLPTMTEEELCLFRQWIEDGKPR